MARLGLGALAGLGCGLLALWVEPGAGGAGVVASVNGRPLDLAQYQRAVGLYASEKRSAVTDDDRSLILERMIEEELLRQYGVHSGLVRSDPGVRAEVLRAVTTSLTAQLDAGDNAVEKTARDTSTALADYLALLRSGASIRWTGGGQ